MQQNSKIMKANILKNIVFLFLIIGCQVGFAQNKKVKRAEFGNLIKAGSYTEYVSKNGETISIGDSLQIETPSNIEKYAHITQNDAYLRADQMNKKLKIKAINVSGDDKKGYMTFFTCKGLGATPVFVKYEDALQTNEIKLLNAATIVPAAVNDASE